MRVRMIGPPSSQSEDGRKRRRRVTERARYGGAKVNGKNKRCRQRSQFNLLVKEGIVPQVAKFKKRLLKC